MRENLSTLKAMMNSITIKVAGYFADWERVSLVLTSGTGSALFDSESDFYCGGPSVFTLQGPPQLGALHIRLQEENPRACIDQSIVCCDVRRRWIAAIWSCGGSRRLKKPGIYQELIGRRLGEMLLD
jgi:hypothetical protein